MKTLSSTLIVRLLDQASGPARGIVSALGGIDRAATRVGEGSLAGRMQTAIARNNAALDETRGRMLDAIGGFYLLKQGITAVTRPAISFESAMADIAKVSGFDATGLDQFGRRLRELAVTEIPMAVDDLAALAAAASQSGVPDEDLFDFTRMTAKAAVAWEMTGAAAGENLAKIRSQLSLTNEETALFADAINHLSDNSAASAADLVDFAKRVSAQGEFFGFAKEQTLAFGAAMVGAGAESEVAATSFRNMGRALTRGVSATKAQRGAWGRLGMDAEAVARSMQEDAEGTTMRVIEALGELPKHLQASTLSDLFGDEARALAPLLNEVDILRRSLKMVADQQDYANSVGREFANRAATSEYALQRFRSQINDVALAIGGALLPGLTGATAALGPLVLRFADFAEANPAVVKGLVLAAGGLVGLKVAAIGARWGFLMMRGGLLSATLPLVRFTSWAAAAGSNAVALQGALAAMSGARFGNLAKAGVAMRGIVFATPGMASLAGALSGAAAGAAALTAPAWGAIALGVAAVGGAGALVWKHWDRLEAIFGGVARRIGEELAPALDALRPALEWLEPIGGAISAGWEGARSALSSFFDWIGSLLDREILSEEGKAAWEQSGFDAADRLISGVKAGLARVGQEFASIPSSLAAIDWSIAAASFSAAGWQLGQSIVDGVKAKIGKLVEWFSGLPGRILASIGSIDIGSLIRWPSIGGGGVSDSEVAGARATGGPVSRGKTYLVGEEGAELFTPDRNGSIVPHSETMSALRASREEGLTIGSSRSADSSARAAQPVAPIINANFYIHGVSDTRAVAKEVMREWENRLSFELRGAFSDG